MPLSAPDLLNRDFLEIRARLLEVAAALDRLERAEGDVSDDPRMARIRQAIARLDAGQGERAEHLQLLFSLAYESGWRTGDLRRGSSAPPSTEQPSRR
jgi:thioredoxin-like negative regulator of GroEL